MTVEKNILLNGGHGKPIATDIFCPAGDGKSPVVIYAHGFNGFKDWANFDIIADKFAEAGFVFVKFNFSHNGTTPDKPEEFTDLNAYGQNNYTIELEDLGSVIDWVASPDNQHHTNINTQEIYLLGHSRGGGIAIIKASEDSRIKKLVTWASVNECKTPWGSWSGPKMQGWRENGVEHVENSRTKQELPIYYQLYENYEQNKDRLDIQAAMQRLTIPVLICHGRKDIAVPVDRAYALHEWNKGSELFIVTSDHVFGRKHPWTESSLPEAMEKVVNKSIEFLKQ
ncbi:MAG: alpha/beta fold hydrolase [Sphingobacteriales bacterium]|nr:MAG: alpha/beta fold hydrolase [Sphingobacteriales bacterium]